MYNNQYPDRTYTSSYPAYQQNYGYNYPDYGQSQYVNNVTTTIQPGPPGEEYPHNTWQSTRAYANQNVAQQPVPQQQQQQPPPVVKSEDNKKEAVAQEIQQQKTQLAKQREEYVRKVRVLRRELELLKNQKQELLSQSSPVRDRDGIIRENEKLQDEIQTKIKAIQNVIEMLSSIIKDGKKLSDLEAEMEEEDSPKVKSVKSEKSERSTTDGKFNFIHYDPELHWCRFCDKFPKTAKEFLLHLQTDKHKAKVQESDVGDNTPWHKLPAEPELPSYEGAPKKRVPIKGLQFFISAPSWYCKLCDTWIGDLHCASHHLKSQAHFHNYANFVEQNPHWEMEWLKDREKALSRTDKKHSSDTEEDQEGGRKKKKHHDKNLFPEKSSKDKKKKKHSKKKKRRSSDSSSSSSSSDSSSEDEDENNDRSRSIRVAMRNIKVQNIMNEDLTGKWEMLGRLVEEHKKKEEAAAQKKKEQSEDNLISQWMTVSEPPEKEKIMLDNLKDRMKQKQEAERAKAAELERKRREKEREELELQERKQREMRELKEREERERKQHELEELERIRDQNRDHVKFRAARDKFRKRPVSSSDEESPKRLRDSEERHYNRRRSTPNRYKRTEPSRRDRGRSYGSHRSRSRSRSKSKGRSSKSRSSKGRSRTRSRSRGKSHEKDNRGKEKHEEEEEKQQEPPKKKPPGPPSYKKLPFIGRMPLFKNKKPEDKHEKEIKKEDYETPRQTRFQPGNLARAFIPEPEVVHFPKLATIPPLITPPPPPVTVQPPAPPKISEPKTPKAPPPPKMGPDEKQSANDVKKKDYFQTDNYGGSYGDTGSLVSQYYPSNPSYPMMLPQMYDFSQNQEITEMEPPAPPPPTMPLLPPPLPPSGDADDLALLGISADDMAAQTF